MGYRVIIIGLNSSIYESLADTTVKNLLLILDSGKNVMLADIIEDSNTMIDLSMASICYLMT